MIEVGRLSPYIDHDIDRNSASKRFIAGITNRAAVETWLWLDLVTPICAKFYHGVEIADQNVDPEVVILSGISERRRQIVKLVEGSLRKDSHERMDALAVDHSAVRRVQPVC